MTVHVPGTKHCWQNTMGCCLLFLSINAVLVGYWVTVTAQLAASSSLPTAGGPSIPSDRYDERPLQVGGVHHHVVEAVEFALSNRTTLCEDLTIRSHVRLCLDTLLPYCRHVTGCSVETPFHPPLGGTSNLSTERRQRADASSSAGGNVGEVDKASVAAVSLPQWTTDIRAPRVTLSEFGARRASSILGSAMQRRLVDRRHNRTHYVCTARETIRDWNLTLRILTYFCSTYNISHDEVVWTEQLLPAARLRWQRAARGNATMARQLETDWLAERRLEAVWWQQNCTVWDTHLAGWAASAEAHLLANHDPGAGLARFEPALSLRGRARWNASWTLEREWMAALRWADRHRTSTYCSEDEDPWMVLPRSQVGSPLSGTPCRWTHEVLMASICTDGDSIGLLEAHRLWGTRREAYGRFRAALKQRREVADAAERAAALARNASGEPPAPTPEDAQADEDDMLRADPALHEGCIGEDFTEVRVAIVGDSTSVAYPRRIHQWLRRLCTHCRDAKMKLHLYNFAVAARKVVRDDADRIGFQNTTMYGKSLRYAPDVVVFMLGTNDALRWWNYNHSQFADALYALLRSYLDGPMQPTVLVLLPPPAFDSIYANRTRQASRKHRARVYLRRVAYADGNVSRCLGDNVLPTIRAVVARLADELDAAARGDRRSLPASMPGGSERLHLVDLYDTVLQWLLDRAAKFAVEKASYHRTYALRWFRNVVPALLESPNSTATRSTSAQYLRGLPIGSLPMQRAIFDAMTDGVHLEKSLQKVVAVEVLRQLWMPRNKQL